MSWHRQYRGKCIGRVAHFVYYYCGFNVMEECTISGDSIHYYGRKIATYRWLDGYDDIPVFEFIDSDSYGPEIEMMRRNQKEKFLEAVSDCQPPKETVQQKILQDVRRNRNLYNSFGGDWAKDRVAALDQVIEVLEKKNYESQ